MDGLLSLLIFAGLFYFMMRYGCGAHMIHGHAAKRKYIDPVCDMEVASDQGYGKVHRDQEYRFCTRSCLNKFDAEPEKYL